MKKILVIWMNILVVALLPLTVFAQAQYLIDGENPASVLEYHSVTITLDPAGIINTSLITAGCLIDYDASDVLITNVVAADSDEGGPWDPGFTSLVPDGGGPGTYMVFVGNWDTVPVDAPIPICEIEFACQATCGSQIIISTIPNFDTIVGDTTVWDSQITDGIIWTQHVCPCMFHLEGPNPVVASGVDVVTEQYFVSYSHDCVNPPNYVWSDDCILADIDQTGLLTVPPTTSYEDCYLIVMDLANTDLGTGEPAESWLSLDIRTEGCVSDVDRDRVPDCSDNCPEIRNGEIWGTCTSGVIGETCYDNEDCGDGGYCSKNQEDLCPPQGNGIGDACDCEGDFDCDNDCDGTDAATFKLDFGRSTFGNPCEDGDPCNGDFGCDGDCDGTDAALFKQDFGRSGFNNPCPACEVEEWCDYSIPPSTTTTTCLPPETPHCTTSSECCSGCCCTFSGPPYPVCDPFTYPSSGDTVNCTELGGTCI